MKSLENFIESMNLNPLESLNKEIEKDILQKKQEVDAKREGRGYVSFGQYFISKLKERIAEASLGVVAVQDLDLSFIDRQQFSGDIAIKVPKILKEKGNKYYISEVVPKLVEGLRQIASGAQDVIVNVESKGIYVNVLLSNQYLFENIWQVSKLGASFGESDSFRKKSVVIDYSSPNVAKHLHAGHIRSTIIGQVLSNLYESVGYTSHRLNYINDWGGIGFLLEGYSRWMDKLPKMGSKNDELYAVYQIYRRGEKTSQGEEDFNRLTPAASDELAQYFGEFGSFEEFKERFNEFKLAANERFRELEDGNEIMFDTWQKMKEWSLEDFNKFYDLTNIHHDYTIGESFYAKRGDGLVEDKMSSGEIVLFTEELAKDELSYLRGELEAGRITDEMFERLQLEVANDIGAFVVLLRNHKRFLVKKSSGATLYATRDLAGIEHKVETFHPARLVYEVGGEQTEYFRNLFEASGVLNLAENGSVSLTHVAHGLYVDSKTGKKLSSREGAEGVERLIKESIKYFRAKYDQRNNEDFKLTDEEKDANARKLAVGSIAFNDIKQDKKFPIAFDQDIEKNIKSFEESGGAYIMYSFARARSIVRKSDVSPEDAIVGTEDYKDLSEDEVSILKMIAEYPRVILKAATNDSPSILAGFLLDLANAYNSYYEKCKVLDKGKLLYPHRLLITDAVATVLGNGLKICHAEAPEII